MAKRIKNASQPKGRPKRFILLLGALGFGLLLGAVLWWAAAESERVAKLRPGETAIGIYAKAAKPTEEEQRAFAQYGGSDSCRECHEEQYGLWKASHHGLAERLIEPAVDRMAFDPPRSFQHGSQRSDVGWSNGVPQVTCIGLSGKAQTHSVARVIGELPLRQFLVPFPGGRFQALEAAFDPRSNQWFNVYGTEDRQPGEWGHWTGRGMNWNYMCASCHSTRLHRNYDEATDTYHTRMAERSVGCEACHGPLLAHNQWQRQFGKSGRPDPTLSKLSPAQGLEVCGSCHARRTELADDFKPGDNFFDHYQLVVVDGSERYYADGQVRDEDYEYGSFLGSRMAAAGVRCLDCHNPHSMKTLLPGNWLCLRCHDGSRTNAPVINAVTHSHHKVFGFNTNGQPVNLDLTAYRSPELKETGGECVNCHMPQTVYMQRHGRHDHGFTIPDPLLTQEFGIPNACNRCHRDKDAAWAAKYCNEWYGQKMERPTRRRAQAIAHAQRAEPPAHAALIDSLNQEQSPYWRAVLLGLLEPWAARPEVTTVLLQALEHPHPLVRATAAAALERSLPAAGPLAVQALQQRLKDPLRGVRLAAVSSLGAMLDPHSDAAREFQQSLSNNADQPTGQLQAGIWCLAHNEPEAALRLFQKAVEWDPSSAPMRQELAVALSALNRPQEALQALKEACRIAPQDAESHYKLALAYNELGELKEATDELLAAVRLEPRHAAAWYNLGLAQSALGQTEEALDSLGRAEATDPDDARIPYASATVLLRLGQNRQAAAAAKRALRLNPKFDAAAELLRESGP